MPPLKPKTKPSAPAADARSLNQDEIFSARFIGQDLIKSCHRGGMEEIHLVSLHVSMVNYFVMFSIASAVAEFGQTYGGRAV